MRCVLVDQRLCRIPSQQLRDDEQTRIEFEM